MMIKPAVRPACAAAFLTLTLAACGSAGQTLAPTALPTNPAPVAAVKTLADCASQWSPTRERVRASGQRDGEARRAADMERASCEAEVYRRLPVTEPPPAPVCGPGPTPVRSLDDALVVTEGEVNVLVTCGGESLGFPAFVVTRETSGSAEASARLQSAVGAWLAGPSPTELEAGYTTVFGTDQSDLLQGVRVQGQHAYVDFTEALERLPNLTASTARTYFLAQAAVAGRQVSGLVRVDFTIAGSCERFALALELDDCDASKWGA